MLKHVYRAIILVVVFCLSVFYFGKGIAEEKFELDYTVEIENAVFPIASIFVDGIELNELHGYSGMIPASLFRDCITPLDLSQTFVFSVDEKESIVKKISYEVYNISTNELIESASMSALDERDGKKEAKIKIKEPLEKETEYALKLTAITKTSKKIHFYTRIKVNENYHTDSYLNFVWMFHKSILDKNRANNIASYLETDYTKEHNDLSYVTIQSNLDCISFGNLKLEVLSEPLPIIKEINTETASVQLKYMASAETDSGTEYYTMEEFYRIRYTNSQMYLLSYNRTMEAKYNNEFISLTENELKIGISNNPNIEVIANSENNRFCFVRERELWYYNLIENQAIKVFSFQQKETDYKRDIFDQHNVRVLGMDEDGNIDFIVYGYMNRGDYEGRVAILLYKFYAGENRIEEKVYIPIDTTYQILKEELDDFSYVSREGIFYFTMNHNIYAYNMVKKSLVSIASHISNNSFLMSREGTYIAWQQSNDVRESSALHILDLEMGIQQTIKANKNEVIHILGGMEQNLIYGYAKKTDLVETKDGTLIAPLYKVQIVNASGSLLKEYKENNIYVTEATVEDNIVTLKRVEKDGTGGYNPIETDSIINKEEVKRENIVTTSRVTEKTKIEFYLKLPQSIILERLPEEQGTENTIITEDTTLRVEKSEEKNIVYYVYALGGILDAFEQVADAINLANDNMGVVIDSNQKLIWERGVKNTRADLGIIEHTNTGAGVNSIGACLNMLLQFESILVDAKQLSERTDSIYQILTEYLTATPINLTGTSLNEVLYYISNGSLVIAMKDENTAVLITAYDEFNITYYDPVLAMSKKISSDDGEQLFANSGNVFLSYIK